MFETVDLDAAGRTRWDVVVAGTSFSAMFFALGLPPGLRVLFVERGPLRPHETGLAEGHRNRPPQMRNLSAENKSWFATSQFGGNSNCWWACTPRMHPNDFRAGTLYGVTADWPLSYDDLAPFYEEVETVMQVNGGGSDAVLPRRAPFPFPAHAPSLTDRALRARSPLWWAQPSARATGGDRTPCCATGRCDRCPHDSKFTILNALDTFRRPEHRLLLETELRAVRIEGGAATGALLRGPDGREAEVAAGHVALGANAFGNSAILLRSDIDNPRIGVGVGEQQGQFGTVDHDDFGPWGGSSITGHGYHFYDGPHRRDRAAVLMEVYNTPFSIRPMAPGRLTRRALVKLIAEDLYQDGNRLVLEDDEPVVEWTGVSDYALDGLSRAWADMPGIMPEGAEIGDPAPLAPSEAHVLGGHVMSADPAQGVTDASCRVHGVSGLHALGSGGFPTCAPANPTLTLSALALRAGRLAA